MRSTAGTESQAAGLLRSMRYSIPENISFMQLLYSKQKEVRSPEQVRAPISCSSARLKHAFSQANGM